MIQVHKLSKYWGPVHCPLLVPMAQLWAPGSRTTSHLWKGSHWAHKYYFYNPLNKIKCFYKNSSIKFYYIIMKNQQRRGVFFLETEKKREQNGSCLAAGTKALSVSSRNPFFESIFLWISFSCIAIFLRIILNKLFL